MRSAFQPPIRALLGLLIGVGVWIGLSVFLPFLSTPLRFILAWAIFTIGPGAAIGASLTRDLDWLTRLIVLLGIGSAITPALVDILGRLHIIGLYPYIAAALAGAGLALCASNTTRRRPSIQFADAVVCVGLVVLAIGLGTVVFWHRITPDGSGGLRLNGLYDSVDLSFYAAWASESSHTIPPMASYFSGHQLNGAYYPQFVLAMVHRFADVSMLDIYFRYAWPAFLSIGALTAFVMIRSLALADLKVSTTVGTSSVSVVPTFRSAEGRMRSAELWTAALAVVLMLTAGEFSYLAAWFLPHATVQWDFLLWPTNFLAPTMEVLHFNTWTPTLPVFFMTIYAAVRSVRLRSTAWTILSAVLLALLFQFKPFAYAILVAGLVGACIFARGDWTARYRFGAILALGIMLTGIFLYQIAQLQEDRRARLLIDFFTLPQRMLIKLDLTGEFSNFAARISPTAALQRPILLALATVLFLAVGLGIRWLALPEVWRAIRRREGDDAAAWRLLAWSAVAGVVVPFVVATDPYVDTLQFYQTGLYLLWIFTAVALVKFARRYRTAGIAAIVVAVAISLPSSIHFLQMKWTDAQRPPLVEFSSGELKIAEHLRTTDPKTTVILHDRPGVPSLMAVVAGRRVTLGWGPRYYAVGSDSRFREINAFYGSARDADPEKAFRLLHTYQVTHVIVREDRDRVHPEVLKRLTPLMRFPPVTLYAVPSSPSS